MPDAEREPVIRAPARSGEWVVRTETEAEAVTRQISEAAAAARLDQERLAAAHAEQQRQRREERERQRRRANSVVARAWELMEFVLSREEYEHFRSTGEIEITAASGTRYQIQQQGFEGNVSVLHPDTNERMLSMCAHPSMYLRDGTLPVVVAWVGQVLALKYDEDQFLSMANIHYTRPNWTGCEEFVRRMRDLKMERRSRMERERQRIREQQQAEFVNNNPTHSATFTATNFTIGAV